MREPRPISAAVIFVGRVDDPAPDLEGKGPGMSPTRFARNALATIGALTIARPERIEPLDVTGLDAEQLARILASGDGEPEFWGDWLDLAREVNQTWKVLPR